mgnify:CR=1 FL=1
MDPLDADWVYVGTDLGVFFTLDGGAEWGDYNEGMPIAMVLDLVIKQDERLMRAATFGNGIYERALPSTLVDAPEVGGAATDAGLALVKQRVQGGCPLLER